MNEEKIKILAIVVNHNNDVLTTKCIERIKQTNYESLDIALIDNGNCKEGGSHAGLWIKEVQHYQKSSNQGFSAACNLGLRWGLTHGYDYFWLINNDLFVEPQTITDLLSAMHNQMEIAACCPKIVYDGSVWGKYTIQYAGGFIQKDCSHWYPRGDFEDEKGQYERVEEVEWLSGACMLIRAKAISDIGLMDERYFLYYEDVDWCLRALNKKWKLLYVGTSKVTHTASSSTKKVKKYYYPRAKFIFLLKHYPFLIRPALRQYFHHSFLPHMKRSEWSSAVIDLKVYINFFWRYIFKSLRNERENNGT